MKFRELAKLLDRSAHNFTNTGDLESAFAAMGLAAIIRRQPKKTLKYDVPENWPNMRELD